MQSNAIEEITVVIPALNEEATIQLTLKELTQLAVKEIIVVDGGSVDGTAEIAERTGARVIVERGLGYGKAVLRGVQEAKGDFVVLFDADATYDPSQISKMVNILKVNAGIGAVVGSRTNTKKSLFAEFLNSIFRLLFGSLTNDVSSSFIVARKNMITDLRLSSYDYLLPIEIRTKLLRNGYTIIEVPVYYRFRHGGKVRLRDGLRILRRIIGLRF